MKRKTIHVWANELQQRCMSCQGNDEGKTGQDKMEPLPYDVSKIISKMASDLNIRVKP
jgi:hypothetical protein